MYILFQDLVEFWKESQGCCKAMAGMGDNFRVVFPPNFSNQDKALLTAAAIFLDYTYFGRREDQADPSAILF